MEIPVERIEESKEFIHRLYTDINVVGRKNVMCIDTRGPSRGPRHANKFPAKRRAWHFMPAHSFLDFHAAVEKNRPPSLRGCLHDTGATFAAERVHSGSLSWLYICLHDTTTKCYAGASHPGVSSPRFSHRGEYFTPVRNLATVSCKRETTTHFGVKSVCR